MTTKTIEQWASALVNEDNVKITVSVVPDESNPDAEYGGEWIIQSGISLSGALGVLGLLALESTLSGVLGVTNLLALESTLVKVIPLPKANIFSSAPPGANVDILGSDIVPTNSPSICRVAFVAGVSTVVKSRVTQGATTLDAYLNSGVALVSGGLYIFDIVWQQGDSLNFQFETNGMVQVLKAYEIGAL